LDRVLDSIDAWLRDLALGVQGYFALGHRAGRFIFVPPFYWADTIAQMDRIGVGSLPIILLTGLFTGMVLALQSSVELSTFGASIYIGNLVGASMVRELGPVLTGLMVTGRIGSAIAAELGSMRVTEQIDAMESMGTDPIKKLVTPRLVATMLMLPALTALADLVGIVGGLIVAFAHLEIPPDVYMRGVWDTLATNGIVLGFFPRDFVGGLGKPIVFGAIIALTGSYYGLHTTGGTEGVGHATTRSVVTASIWILATDYFLTQILLVLLPSPA
jgi:phospholipid/cholesterol/gamma-HCH transport system permease protein